MKHRVLPQNRLQGAEYGIAPEPAAGCSLVWSATWAANPRFLQGQHTAAPKTLEIPSARTAPTQCPLVFSQVGGQFSQLFKDFDALSQSFSCRAMVPTRKNQVGTVWALCGRCFFPQRLPQSSADTTNFHHVCSHLWIHSACPYLFGSTSDALHSEGPARVRSETGTREARLTTCKSQKEGAPTRQDSGW